MYSYGYSYGYGLIGGNTYNPLINYDWSTTTTSGLRYLNDVGSTPTYNASMYFGRGAYLNGVDQTITVPINTTIQTALKRVNGVVTINETLQTLTNYVISGLGVHKDYYLFTRLLTTAEKESYTNTPELFYAMAQVDSTCVLNMPMCETDGYVRNMKSYSEVPQYIDNTISGLYGGTADVNGDKITFTITTAEHNLRKIISVTESGYYLIGAKYGVVTNPDSGFGLLNGSKYVVLYAENIISSNKEIYSAVYLDNTISYTVYLVRDISRTSATGIIEVNEIILKKLSNIYPITNYTSSVRDNAKNLRYGLQTCKFVRDSLGVIQCASDYLECDGVGYGLTSFNPKIEDGDYSFEAIFYNERETTIKTIFGNERTSIFSAGDGFVYFAIHGKSLFSSAPPTNQYIYGCLTFNSLTGKISYYINGVFFYAQIFTGFVNSISNIGIATKTFNNNAFDKFDNPIRSLRVHNKELTQEEITENYNSYVAKGLLS